MPQNLSEEKECKYHLPEVKTVTFIAIFMCFLAASFYCYEYYLRVAPSVMTSQLMQTFNISNASLGILVAYYYYAYTPVQIPVGIMMDRYGPRIILTFACFICAVGTLLFTSNSLLLAKIGRFFVGFGSAFAFVGVLKITSLWLPRKYFALVAGLCTFLGTLGAMSGQVLMTDFVEKFGWRTTLYYASLFGLILTVVIWVFIRNKADRELKDKGRASHENRSMWDELKEVMSIKAVWVAGLIGCFAYLPLSVFAEMWAVPFLKSSGLSSYDAAWGSSLVLLGFGVGGPFWGWFSDFISSRKIPLMLGNLLAAIASLYIIWFMPSSALLLNTSLFLCGVFASAEILVFAVGNDACKPRLCATTIAFINMLVMVGGIVLTPLVGYILDYLTTNILSEELVVTFYEYQKALLILPVGLILGALLCLKLKETHHNFVLQNNNNKKT